MRVRSRGTSSTAWASLAAVPSGLLVGGLCGLGNGLVITRLHLTPFVATLGMMSVARGLAIWLSGRTRVSFSLGSRPGWVDSLSRTSHPWLFFDPGVWTLAFLAVAVVVRMVMVVFVRVTVVVLVIVRMFVRVPVVVVVAAMLVVHVPMLAVVVAVLVMVVVDPAAVAHLVVLVVTARVGACLGLERRLHVRHLRAELRQHLLQHVVHRKA